MILKQLWCSHEWSKWTKAIETDNHIYKAQFKSCIKCNKIHVSFIELYTGGSSCYVRAETINEALQ
jgi:hypothetical protein